MPTMNRFGTLCLGAACAALTASFALKNEAEATLATALAFCLLIAAIKLAGSQGITESDDATPDRLKDSE